MKTLVRSASPVGTRAVALLYVTLLHPESPSSLESMSSGRSFGNSFCDATIIRNIDTSFTLHFIWRGSVFGFHAISVA